MTPASQTHSFEFSEFCPMNTESWSRTKRGGAMCGMDTRNSTRFDSSIQVQMWACPDVSQLVVRPSAKQQIAITDSLWISTCRSS